MFSDTKMTFQPNIIVAVKIKSKTKSYESISWANAGRCLATLINGLLQCMHVRAVR